MEIDHQLLQSALTSIQVDQTFKVHMKDPQIVITVCQWLVQRYPDQAKDIHVLMDLGEISPHSQQYVPEYVMTKLNTIADVCDKLQIPFPVYLLQSSEFTPPLLITEAFFNEYALVCRQPFDYAIGLDIGGTNACISVYHSLNGQIESIPDPKGSLHFGITGLSYYEILKTSKMYAEKFLQHPVWKIFVCLPMDVTVVNRLQLQHAATMCHLELLGTSNSPQLTAFHYGVNVKTEHSVVICDVGAKSIDVGYFLIEDGFVEVKSIFFDDSLGTHSIDSLLFDHYHREISSRFQTLLPDDPFSNSHLMKLCEQLKIHLSNHENGEMNCNSVLNTLHFQKPLSRSQFEEICSPYFARCAQFISHLFSHHFPTQSVDEILLIGGGSYIPAIQSIFKIYLKSESAREKNIKIQGNEFSAVKGAALLAALRSNLISPEKDIANSLLVDVVTHNLSILVSEGLQSVIVSRCTSIPLFKSQLFTTSYDNQTAALIQLFESVGEDQTEERGINRSTALGWMILENLPERPRGELKISVIVDVSSSYEVKVTAQEAESGATKSMIVALDKSAEVSPIPSYYNIQKLFLDFHPVHHES